MSLFRTLLIAFLASVFADENQYYNQQANYNGNDDGMQGYNQNYLSNQQQGDDYIKYWTDYQIVAKRCIVYKNVDQIIFQVFTGNDHCTSEPIGTYVTPVPYYMQGSLAQEQQKYQDMGQDDYALPDAAQYISCVPYETKSGYYWMQLGCADDTTQALAVNIYEDNQCTKRSLVEGYDDANIDVSAIQLQFKKCKACVNWYNMDNDQWDDAFFENHQMQAPLCSTAWNYKQTCGNKCRHVGLQEEKEGWTKPDKIMLVVLVLFSAVMTGLILKKRQKMSSKDALLEQAAMNAAGLQTTHVIGMFALVVLVIAVFAALGLKNVTWILLLGMNLGLFIYLMKLTYDSIAAEGDSLIGPDGEILRRDSDDSSVEEGSRESSSKPNNNGTYQLPTIT
uniref:Uncharacterized protein n=1 Tax=Amphora coffeiformis TaxID=265554 RepID=A0A7S3L6C9_9STRA